MNPTLEEKKEWLILIGQAHASTLNGLWILYNQAERLNPELNRDLSEIRVKLEQIANELCKAVEEL